jgi:DNA repair protein RadA/Sms
MGVGYKCGLVGEGCGMEFVERYKGPCPSCGGWYSIKTISTDMHGALTAPPPRGQRTTMSQITTLPQERISTGFEGIDLILGHDADTNTSGIAATAGQVVQICGEPGAGKSTVLLQICRNITRQGYPVLYISGEESLQQIKARADRVGRFNSKFEIIDETDLDKIQDNLADMKPSMAVIDSIQTVCVEGFLTGSQASLTTASRELYKYAQSVGLGMFFIVQMNKAGNNFAGPKTLEHIIDTSLYAELLPNDIRRISCTEKNRFGRTPTKQYFDMTNSGLVEIEDPYKKIDKEEVTVDANADAITLENETSGDQPANDNEPVAGPLL